MEPHSEDACLCEERELCLINLKAFRGELDFHPHAGVGGLPFSLTGLLSINSTSGTLSKTIGKLVLLM